MTEPSELDARADTAAASVQAIFGKRLLGLPGTWLPTVAGPGRRIWRGPWHYWWHAHVIDALLDQAEREQATGRHADATYAVRRATALLRTVRLRNLGIFTNHYYDDMAWIVLAAHRLDQIGGPKRLPRSAGRAIAPRLRRGDTPDLGGGVYWNDHHDFKNAPATGPAALHFARIGETERARRLLAWVHDDLHDEQTGLVIDGLRPGPTPESPPQRIELLFTYNQGTVIGALVELGDEASMTEAARLIRATREHLTVDPQASVLRTHDTGDGGLFTGILVRYLALAARSPALPQAAREDATALIHGTADALWTGRQSLTLPSSSARMPAGRRRHHEPVVFSPYPLVPARESQPDGIPIELSTQVQAWTILEAAASLSPTRRSTR